MNDPKGLEDPDRLDEQDGLDNLDRFEALDGLDDTNRPENLHDDPYKLNYTDGSNNRPA